MFFAYESHLTDKELAIMTDLLKYRVLTTKQIRDRHFDGKGRYVENVLLKLRKDEFIRSSTLKRSRKGKKGYSVHQLTETGKECLQRHDLSVEGQSSWNIYVNEHNIPNILLTNETLFEYEDMGWSVLDSREVKHLCITYLIRSYFMCNINIWWFYLFHSKQKKGIVKTELSY